MKLIELHFADVAKIQEAVTDELKKVQKGWIFGSFSETVDRAKYCIYGNEDYFEWKKVSSSCAFDLKKKE
jgi:hypothetical protein